MMRGITDENHIEMDSGAMVRAALCDRRSSGRSGSDAVSVVDAALT